jgi:hypothetical protein
LAFLLFFVAPAVAQQSPGDTRSSQDASKSPSDDVPQSPSLQSNDETKSPQPSSSGAPAAAPLEPVPTVTPSGDHRYSLTANYSIDLSPEWAALKSSVPPPAGLGPYAPPFHLSGNLRLENSQRGAILQFATSDNPLVGHDAYWLDSQMHSASGSEMTLLDFFFYYFFPPSEACMHQVLTTYADASRVPPSGGLPSYMQVYYSCPVSDTLSGFYSSQISSGITFRKTDNGTRVLAPVGDFYIAPMDRVEASGMTFFLFEAQDLNQVSSEAANRFHLPPSLQGGQPDFFWAIGAKSPFPFVADPLRKDPLLHVAYARLGSGGDARSEFTSILRAIQVK